VENSRLVIVCFKMEPEEVKKLDQLATVLKTNRSSLIRRAIREFIERQEKPVETPRVKIL
jgi:predicted transcriptional regulator